MQICRATIEDMDRLVSIYNQSIAAGGQTADLDAYTIEQRTEWFLKFDDHYPLYVLKSGELVIGYCSISPYRAGRRALERVAEISYYLDTAYQGRGLGTLLVRRVIRECKRKGFRHLIAILLDTNQASEALLIKMGFERWGKLPDIAHIGKKTCGQLIYGLSLEDAQC